MMPLLINALEVKSSLLHPQMHGQLVRLLFSTNIHYKTKKVLPQNTRPISHMPQKANLSRKQLRGHQTS